MQTKMIQLQSESDIFVYVMTVVIGICTVATAIPSA